MMKDLLELILKNITLYPDEVNISMEEEDGREVYTIVVNPEDMGRVIGKNGKVIRALRSLAHVIAIRQNKRFRINVAEVDEQGNPIETSTNGTIEVNSDEPKEASEPEEVAEPEEVIEEETEEVKESADDIIADAIDTKKEE